LQRVREYWNGRTIDPRGERQRTLVGQASVYHVG
jgi:hypothetical protein